MSKTDLHVIVYKLLQYVYECNRHGEGISWKTLETICTLCNCQPGDLIEYVPEEEGE